MGVRAMLALLALWALAHGAEAASRRRKGGGHKYSSWTPAHATFYGGLTAAGTMGGACGYGNLYQTGYGTATAAASTALWYGGKACGGCYEAVCQGSKWCKRGSRVVVTVTNNCPHGSEGGWCDGYKKHLDMAFPSWARIGRDKKAGVLPTLIRRVPCVRSGGIAFQVSGNPYFLQVLIFNVAGPGDIGKVEVMSSNGRWTQLNQNWGAVYSGRNPGFGRPLSFRITAFLFQSSVTCMNVAPRNWGLGKTYQGRCQFT